MNRVISGALAEAVLGEAVLRRLVVETTLQRWLPAQAVMQLSQRLAQRKVNSARHRL